MDLNSPPPCPNTVTVRRNPPRRARPTTASKPPQPRTARAKSDKTDVTPFPTQEILSMEIPQTDPASSALIEPPVSENLKVYLRIRPLVPIKPIREAERKKKNAWPQNPAAKLNKAKSKAEKMKNSEVCVSVTDFQSVTLTPPLALQESKRIKAVVYDGFSHVFASDTSQSGVYEKMVKPLVEDFLNGKRGMIAALGPSGSGKTHTVFGTVREPGMVPLALQHIFNQTQGDVSKQYRSFYISIFEISSEGKAERLFDLSPDGAELSMQQSVIKGLQEVPITNAEQAESLIASAMLKRATAMTNTNSQSSRSQCIINIHSLVNKSNRELDIQLNTSVLTIVDLAGAERERKTGNQGSRLLESNFINNTSMVFGLCLRSLLEHQKNPKKPLQKHFQNSMLTRYLRDYLEGKRRMALILTVKPGEEDYLDTSYLLRQASPYMKIKFNNVEELPTTVHQKRRLQPSSRVEEPKRKKYCDLDTQAIEEGKSSGEEDSVLQGCATVVDASRITKFDSSAIPSKKSDCVDVKRQRDHQIMQNFAKAIWNVLKEYKEKLKAAEKEIDGLNENLRHEKTRYAELEKEHEVFKSFCTCSKETLVNATFLKVDKDYDVPVYLDGNECNNVFEADLKRKFSNPEESECASGLKGNQDPENEGDEVHPFPYQEASGYPSTPSDGQDATDKVGANDPCHSKEASQTKCSPIGHMDVTNQMDDTACSSVVEESKCDCTPRSAQKISSPMGASATLLPSNLKASKCSKPTGKDQNVLFENNTNSINLQALNKEDAAVIENHSLCKPDCEIKSEASGKSSKLKKPKRRLMPASTILLRDTALLGIEDEPEKPKMKATVLSPEVVESKCCGSQGSAQSFSSPAHADLKSRFSNPEESECASGLKGNLDPANEGDEVHPFPYQEATEYPSTPRDGQDATDKVGANDHSHGNQASQTKSSPRDYIDVTNQMDETVCSPVVEESKIDCTPRSAKKISSPMGASATLLPSNLKASKCSKPTGKDQTVLCENNTNPINPQPLNKEDGKVIEKHSLCKPDRETKFEASGKSSNLKKPKRRLMPASTILLRDFALLGLEDEPEKPKGNRGGKKLVANERTQGSKTLIRLLQSNLHL